VTENPAINGWDKWQKRTVSRLGKQIDRWPIVDAKLFDGTISRRRIIAGSTSAHYSNHAIVACHNVGTAQRSLSTSPSAYIYIHRECPF